MQHKSVDFSARASSATFAGQHVLSASSVGPIALSLPHTVFMQFLLPLTLQQRKESTALRLPELAHSFSIAVMQSNSREGAKTVGWVGEQKDGVSKENERKERQYQVQNMHQKRKICEWVVFSSGSGQFLADLTLKESMLQQPNLLIDLLNQNCPKNSQKREQELAQGHTLQAALAFFHRCRIKGQLEQELNGFIKESLAVNLRQLILDGINRKWVQKELMESKQPKREAIPFIKSLDKAEKLRLLLLDCKGSEELRYHLHKQLIAVPPDILQQEIGQLLNCPPQQLWLRISQCTYAQLASPLTLYHQLIFQKLMRKAVSCESKKIARNREERQHRQDRDYNSQKKEQKERPQTQRKKNGKPRKATSVQSNQTNETEQERNLLSNAFDKRQAQIKPSHQRSARQQLHSQQREERSVKGQFKDKPKQIATSARQLEKNPQVPREQTPKKNLSHCSKPVPSCPIQVLRQISLSKLSEQLQQMSDTISQQTNKYHQRRIIAFQRIQYLLQCYQIPIKLFGSCANGIAIKNSDIDIAVDHSLLYGLHFLTHTEQLTVALQRLQSLLQEHPCFTQLNLIGTANIPVLKVTIDTNIQFCHPLLNRSHHSGEVQADITIQTPSFDPQTMHLGLRTTAVIGKWLSEMPCLSVLVITLKQFLADQMLHLPYQGGLNTLTLIVMLVALIRKEKLQEEENGAKVLERVMRFYVYEFDERVMGIDLLRVEGEQVFYHKGEQQGRLQKAQLQILDPICESKNMTRNCYLYPQIKKLFKTILENCIEKAHCQLELLMQQQEGLVQPEVLEGLNCQTYRQRNLFLELHQSLEHSF